MPMLVNCKIQERDFLLNQWENKSREYSGISQSYLNWKVDRYSYKDLIDLYIAHLNVMSEHTFMALWNYCQFKLAKKNLVTGEVLLIHDYAQNYLSAPKQGMHWEHKQVMMHPSVAYYKCPTDTCNKLVTHEVVHLSDDLKHDAHLVKRFHTKTIDSIKWHNIPIHNIIQFTDQAPSQYKNKTAFKYLSQRDLPTMLNFFGI